MLPDAEVNIDKWFTNNKKYFYTNINININGNKLT